MMGLDTSPAPRSHAKKGHKEKYNNSSSCNDTKNGPRESLTLAREKEAIPAVWHEFLFNSFGDYEDIMLHFFLRSLNMLRIR